MRKIVMLLVALASPVALAFSPVSATPTSSNPITVERRCLFPTDHDLAHPIRLTVAGLAVDLLCGDRFVVLNGQCHVQRGFETTVVPCTLPPSIAVTP
jgi:hypothetical protein